MSSTRIDWTPAPLSTDEQMAVDAYLAIGVPLDALVYTEDFRKLVKRLGRSPDVEADLRRTYVELLSLRKRGRLPRIYRAD